jgi:hypothetical protein
MATYVDMEGYHSHQRNPELELLHLHAKMCRAKAEVEVYELAIENAPASNSSDSNGEYDLLALSSKCCSKCGYRCSFVITQPILAAALRGDGRGDVRGDKLPPGGH